MIYRSSRKHEGSVSSVGSVLTRLKDMTKTATLANAEREDKRT